MIIDAHQHFWRYHPVRHAWITPDMAVIRRDFGPADIVRELEPNKVAGCIAVQADQSEAETEYLLKLARANPFIRGVIGWVDMRSPNVAQRLHHYCGAREFRGVRHIAQAERDDFLDDDHFNRGLACLQEIGLAYDILVYPRQLPAVIRLVRRHPDQQFVVDHLAKPLIRAQRLEPWEADLRELAKAGNVHCKISGLVTEADWRHWAPVDFKPYLDVAFEAFGVDRLLFGSDWPVCLVAASYGQVVGILSDYLASAAPLDRSKVFGANALHVYQVSV